MIADRQIRADKITTSHVLVAESGAPGVTQVEHRDGRVLISDSYGRTHDCTPDDLLDVHHRSPCFILADLKEAANASGDARVIELVNEAFDAGMHDLV